MKLRIYRIIVYHIKYSLKYKENEQNLKIDLIEFETKYSLNSTIYKFNNESIQSEQLIIDAFAKNFSSIYIWDKL